MIRIIKSLIAKLNQLERKDKAYVSDTDLLLQQLSEDNSKLSESQLQEIAKHRNIFNRDTTMKKVKW